MQKKTIRKIIIFLLMTIIITGCTKEKKEEEKNKNVIGKEDTNNEYLITNFTYDISSSNDMYYSFYLEEKEGETYLIIEGFDANHRYSAESQIEKEYIVQEEWIEGLESIIEEKNIASWNGFNESSKDVKDGSSFEIYIQYKDNTEIQAKGYVNTPDNYKETQDILVQYLLNGE